MTDTVVIQDDELLIERIFDAPVALLYRVWTQPEHLVKWWSPKAFTPLSITHDLVVGGAYRYGVLSPDGTEVWMTGVFQEIVPDEKIAMTFRWESGAWDVDNLITVTFQGLASGRTLVRFHQTPFKTVAGRDAHTDGWNSVLDKLAAYLETFA